MTRAFLQEALKAVRRKPRAKVVFFYGDSGSDESPYEIEIGDEVEFVGDGSYGPATHLGEITAIQTKNKTAKVVYLDETDWNKTGDPKRKVAFVPLSGLTLIRRVQ
ncbi:MAG: hypothetical protein JXR75_13725 [Rhodobacteraceae bacterium]|nr:hypothetical protein [Paracoccaceae bacterium]